ncbi:MAG: hypothetical protein OSJ62_12355 [Lachnospiraceae bacterium]|nr:hypothetical protein [Lachnospiraceae bacterium]
MKLGGVKIINLDSLKGKFDLEEVWENIENGVLLDCQRELAKQGADLAEIIAEVLETLEKEEEPSFLFYRDGRWNLEELEHALKPFSTKSKDHKGNSFYSRNKAVIWRLLEQKQIHWSQRKAALFFLFLLLMLQVHPRAEIQSKEVEFLEKTLKSVDNGKEKRKYTGFRLYPYSSGVLYQKDGKIQNEQGKCFSSEQEEIDFFTYTEKLGILAFTKQGEISECTDATLKHEIAGKLKGVVKESGIAMAAAYGSVYLLLTKGGEVISNVKDSISGWNDICWVGAGLNSLTAVREKNRNLLELGSDSKITEFSNVKAAYTWSGGTYRYGVLKENGIFIMDDGVRAEQVLAANIEREGYVYAVKDTIYFRRFGEKQEVSYLTALEGTIAEVWKYRDRLYFLTEKESEEQIGSVKMKE